ncbi:MAG: putative 4-hydroxybenzoate polyprenyltransferase [Gemmatimonadetes bacterium]|nr:putative 4-hydroxybenzoate polyprenyltransferase [Gemmatimonadota bacterium]
MSGRGGGDLAEGQTLAGTGWFVRYANFVKLPHTLFALPFALVGVALGSFGSDVSPATVGWVVLAFTAARFAAMGFNRIADRAFDARNPRTAMRELPAGTMSVREASAAVTVSAALFVFAAWMINPLCFALSPVALAWVFFYSYTKRFTRWSHLVLGLGLGIAPVGGYLAVTGSWSDPWWMLVALAGAVMTWTAGFDIIYSVQDVDIDRAEGLHSLPSRIGREPALSAARGLHVLTVLALATVGFAMGTGRYYYIGAFVAAIALVYEHALVRKGNLQKAFFVVNMALSTVFLVFVLLERALPYAPVWQR